MLRRCQPRLTQSSLPSVTGRPAGDTAGPHAHTCARNCSLIMHKYTIAHLRCFLSCPYKKEHGWLHAQNKCGLIRHVKVEFKVKQLFVNAVIFFSLTSLINLFVQMKKRELWKLLRAPLTPTCCCNICFCKYFHLNVQL